MGIVTRLTDYAKQRGVVYTLRRCAQKAGERFLGTYTRVWQGLAPGAQELAAQVANQPDAGLISIVVPVYNTRPELLEALCASFMAQTYANWEACLYDGCSTNPLTRAALEKAAAMDGRIRVEFGAVNENISGNTNRAIAAARGEYIVLCDHDDLLTPDALWRVAKAIADTGAEMLYSDEDKVTEDGRQFTDPHCKPDFCVDNLRSSNYICHLLALKKTLVEAVGGLRSVCDGSQDHDLALRCAMKANRVAHIPYILYHWRTVGSSESHQHLERCQRAACRAVEDETAQRGYPCQVEPNREVLRLRYDIAGMPTVQAILLNADGNDTAALEKQLQDMWSGLTCAVCPVEDTGAARYDAINKAAAAANADYLLVMDTRVAPQNNDFIRELLMYAQRDDVGAVTPALVDVRGHIVHAGFALMDSGLAVCRNKGLLLTAGGWHNLAMQSHNVAAVSAACLMIRRDYFTPFADAPAKDEMIAWCARLHARGLNHVYTPHSPACAPKTLPQLQAVRLARPMRDPCMSSYHTQGTKADFILRKGVKPPCC